MMRLKSVRLSFPQFLLAVEDEELNDGITGLFGPSGAGKTTLLEVIAGIRRPDSGRIEIDGVLLTDADNALRVPIEQRRIGYVPQDLALFPHLSVQQNLLFGAHGKRSSVDFDHIVKVLEIQPLLARGIANLSGGEKQRVAFARAVLATPRLLMLDEPLASLDRSLKSKMAQYLLHISSEFKIPMIYVSHDPDEITQLCSRVLLMENGRIVQRGNPSAILV